MWEVPDVTYPLISLAEKDGTGEGVNAMLSVRTGNGKKDALFPERRYTPRVVFRTQVVQLK
jgi:hypothetical protein